MDHSENYGILTPSTNVGDPGASVSSAPCQTDSGSTILLQLFEFKTHLLEAVEELHIRKDAETRFEDQISKLVLEKQELEWEKEALQREIEQAVNQHSESLTNVKKQFQAKIRNLEEEKGTHQVSAEFKDKEINNLKEELRSLQLLKYNLEKKSNELEQKLALQSRSKDSHLNQLGEVEKRFGALSKQCAMVKQAHEKLEQNVDEAMRLNNKLASANKKQEATIVSLTKELEKVNSKLIKDQMTSVRCDRTHSFTGQEQEIQKLLQKLKMETEMNNKLQVDNVAVRAEKQKVMRSLHQTQELLLSQTQTISRAELELQTQREQYQALKQEHEVMRDKRKAVEDKLEQLMESYAASKTSWDKEKKTLLYSIKSEQQDLRSVKEAYDELHQKHSELSSLAKAQAQHISELEMTNCTQSHLRVSLEVSPLNELTSSSHLTSQTKKSDGSEHTGAVSKLVEATGEQEVIKQQLQSGSPEQPLTASHWFSRSLITSSESHPAVVSDLTHTTFSTSDDDVLISIGNSAASMPKAENSLIKEQNENDEEGSMMINERKPGGKNDGQPKSNRKEVERNEEQVIEKEVNEERSAEEMRGTIVTQKRGTVDRCEKGKGSAEDAGNTRNPESETGDRGVGLGTKGAKEGRQKPVHTLETQILTQTATQWSNTLEVTDFMDTEPSLAVCEPLDRSPSLCERTSELNALSSHVNKARGTQSLSLDDGVSNDPRPDSPIEAQNLCPGEVQTQDTDPFSQIHQDMSTAKSEPSEPLSQAMACSAPTNSAPLDNQREIDIVPIQESETDTGQTIQSKKADITINVKPSDDMCLKHVSEERVSPQSQEISEHENKQLELLATNDDVDDSSAKREHHSNVVTQENCDRDTVQEHVEKCAVKDVSVDITMDAEDMEEEAESGSVQDDIKKDKKGDDGETKVTKMDMDMKLSTASTGPKSTFVKGSEQNMSGSGGSLSHPPSRIFMFPRSKRSKAPLVITRASVLLNASSVSGNAASSTRRQQGEWKALEGTFRETRAADTENRAALTSSPVSGLPWKTTPGCSRAPGSAVAPVSDCGSETTCSQEKEEQESSFQAQISKIEQFLITEKLCLPKRRKTDD